jgi:hypothetical protein
MHGAASPISAYAGQETDTGTLVGFLGLAKIERIAALRIRPCSLLWVWRDLVDRQEALGQLVAERDFHCSEFWMPVHPSHSEHATLHES